MKRLISLLFITAILLAACSSSQLSITEIQSIPSQVQERILTDTTLQLVNDSDKGNAYVIFQSSGTVTAQLEVKENVLHIKLDSEEEKNSELQQHVYKITRGDAQYDTVNVIVNGRETYFDNASGF